MRKKRREARRREESSEGRREIKGTTAVGEGKWKEQKDGGR